MAKDLGDAIAAERDSVADRVDQGEQLDLLGDDERQVLDQLEGIADAEIEDLATLPDGREIAEIQRELDCDVYRAVTEYRRRQGKGGRKVGALNRRNAEFRQYLLSIGPHPGATLARIQGRSVELLAAELGCSKKEALDRQIRCAVELLPYVEGKMPTNVNLSVRGDFQLVAGAGTGLFDGIEDAEFDELPELGFSSVNQDDSAPSDGE